MLAKVYSEDVEELFAMVGGTENILGILSTNLTIIDHPVKYLSYIPSSCPSLKNGLTFSAKISSVWTCEGSLGMSRAVPCA